VIELPSRKNSKCARVATDYHKASALYLWPQKHGNFKCYLKNRKLECIL